MSRLIDVDKAENDIVENVTTKAVSRVVAILQGQPTVKAIPIEWIKEKLNRYWLNYEFAKAIDQLLEMWEKEKETNQKVYG